MNPSIGDASIGAFTASFTASGTNLDAKGDEVDGDEAEVYLDEEMDRESASHKAIASIKSAEVKEASNVRRMSQLNSAGGNVKSVAFGFDEMRSYDSYSMTMSEKSVNPSVMALAGSIKALMADNQSVLSDFGGSAGNGGGGGDGDVSSGKLTAAGTISIKSDSHV